MQKLKKNSATYQRGTTSTKNYGISSLAKKLADHILWNHKINLEPGTSLKFFPTYKLTKVEK